MPEHVRDLMTSDPRRVGVDKTIAGVAQMMRDEDIGDVIVSDGDRLVGVVTDRDIVIRAVAEGLDPVRETVDAVFSGDVTTVAPDTPIEEAVRVMRENAVRRLPVVDGEQLVGIISLGDLAMARDENSALADISAAPPNK
jgi:CBS domain-containing protein